MSDLNQRLPRPAETLRRSAAAPQVVPRARVRVCIAETREVWLFATVNRQLRIAPDEAGEPNTADLLSSQTVIQTPQEENLPPSFILCLLRLGMGTEKNVTSFFGRKKKLCKCSITQSNGTFPTSHLLLYCNYIFNGSDGCIALFFFFSFKQQQQQLLLLQCEKR